MKAIPTWFLFWCVFFTGWAGAAVAIDFGVSQPITYTVGVVGAFLFLTLHHVRRIRS